MGKTTKIIDKFTTKEVSRQRKWQLRHPEAQKAIWQRYAKRTMKAYYQKTKLKRQEYSKKHHAQNREHDNEYARQYYIKNRLN